jgi:hypothetical protein
VVDSTVIRTAVRSRAIQRSDAPSCADSRERAFLDLAYEQLREAPSSQHETGSDEPRSGRHGELGCSAGGRVPVALKGLLLAAKDVLKNAAAVLADEVTAH